MSEILAKIKELCQATRKAFRNGKRLNDLDESQVHRWEEFLKSIDIKYKNYDSSVGNMVFGTILEDVSEHFEKPDSEFNAMVKAKFIETKDQRAEIGQILSHTKKIAYPKRKEFEENAQSVVLILATGKANLPEADDKDELLIDSRACAELLDFTCFDPGYAGMTLCHSFFYHKELIPNCLIFGSGCFIDSDKIVTAAHVLEAITDASTKADDLLFIRGHWIGSGKNMVDIKVKKDEIYELAQPEIIDNKQIIYGTKGDIAWLKVKPYYPGFGMNDDSGYTGALNLPSVTNPVPPQKDDPAYAIGHGLGVPMKLSFGSKVEFIDQIGWMGCDMDVFPGNSGSPIFHSESHELIGVVSGANGFGVSIEKNPSLGENCITMKVIKDGELTVINSQLLSILPTLTQL